MSRADVFHRGILEETIAVLPRPAKILLIAVLGTQIVATLIAVYGFLMPPLSWGWAGFVWGYALLWFLVTDPVKLLAYRILDPVKAVAKIEPTIEVKANAQIETKVQPPVPIPGRVG